MIEGYDFNDEYYEERLYSTGNDDLDYLLEKAFCDGYEFYQKEFDLKDDIKEALRNNDEEELNRLRKKAKRKSAGIGAGIGAGHGGLNLLASRETVGQILNKAERTGGKKTRRIVGGLGIGLGLGTTTGVGAAIGSGIGKSRYNRALREAKKELDEEKKGK